MAEKPPEGPYIVREEGRRWLVYGPGLEDGEECGKDASDEAQHLQVLLNIAFHEGHGGAADLYGEVCSRCKHATAFHSVDGGCQDEFCRCGEAGSYGDSTLDSVCECGHTRADHKIGAHEGDDADECDKCGCAEFNDEDDSCFNCGCPKDRHEDGGTGECMDCDVEDDDPCEAYEEP